MLWNPEPDDQKALSIKLPEFGDLLSREECMDLAYGVALRGAGWAGKNPMVGAVAVDSRHRFLGAGAHLKDGEAHAEAHLIDGLRSEGVSESVLRDAVIYCTLEPCSFKGRTGSCAGLLSAVPVRQVVCAGEDSHARVRGSGFKMLRENGVSCEVSDEFWKKAGFLSERSLWYHLHKTPFVGLKAASGLDGIFALKKGGRYWLTGERSRNYGHWLRQVYDGIMVGPDTVISDNPALDVRVPVYNIPAPPEPVVLDLKGRALLCRKPEEQKLLNNQERRVFWVLSREALETQDVKNQIGRARSYNCRLKVIEVQGFRLEVNRLLKQLGCCGVTSLLLEGGAGVWAAFLEARAVGRLHFFQSMKLTGEPGLSWSKDLLRAPGLEICPESVRVTPLEEDLLIEGRFLKMT